MWPGKLRIGGEQKQEVEPWREARSRINQVSSFAVCGNCQLPAFPGAAIRSRLLVPEPGEAAAGVEGSAGPGRKAQIRAGAWRCAGWGGE